jgi:hypothetical protein
MQILVSRPMGRAYMEAIWEHHVEIFWPGKIRDHRNGENYIDVRLIIFISHIIFLRRIWRQYFSLMRIQGSSVSIVTRQRIRWPEFHSRQGQSRNFSFFAAASKPVLGPTQAPIQWVPGALSSGVKRPDREADHSTASSNEIRNASNYTSIPTYVVAWYLVK